jgi:beta-mannosidase
LPDVVQNYSAKTNYITTSPLIGWGHKESLSEGDSHYWGVWWGNEPFNTYEKKVGRFMSEYGFQSMPPINTFKSVCDSSDLNLFSPCIKSHQKHPTGYQTIEKYMLQDFKIPKTLEHYSYVSQLLQAKGMQTAIEAHRRAKPYCMGTLFWQLNDCWPVTSWSALDFYKQPKAFYYDLKRLYDNVLVSVTKSGLYYECHVLNEQLNEVKGIIELSVKDFNGNVIYQKKSEAVILPNSSLVYLRLTEDELKTFDKSACYISCRLIGDSTTTKKTLFYFVPPKDLKLPKPVLDIAYSDEFRSIKIKSKTLVKNLYIKDISYTENNYFDLEANEEVEFTVLPFGKTHQNLTFISLYDILSH